MRENLIFLASKSEQENQILQRKIDCLDLEFQGLRFVGSHAQGVAASVTEGTAVVIFNLPEWTSAETDHIRELRAARFSGPVIVVAKAAGSPEFERMKAVGNVIFVEKPYDTKDLVGILRKLLTERAVAQRIHRRYQTDESAVIAFGGETGDVSTRISNMSKGGAHLEFDNKSLSVRVGDVVQMMVELKAVNRTYTVPARVVWAKEHSAGVEFTGAPDIKRSLMSFF